MIRAPPNHNHRQKVRTSSTISAIHSRISCTLIILPKRDSDNQPHRRILPIPRTPLSSLRQQNSQLPSHLTRSIRIQQLHYNQDDHDRARRDQPPLVCLDESKDIPAQQVVHLSTPLLARPRPAFRDRAQAYRCLTRLPSLGVAAAARAASPYTPRTTASRCASPAHARHTPSCRNGCTWCRTPRTRASYTRCRSQRNSGFRTLHSPRASLPGLVNANPNVAYPIGVCNTPN